MLLGGRSAKIAQQTSMNSHVFPANPTILMHQNDHTLIKDRLPPFRLLGKKEVIAAPNSISLSFSDNRSSRSPLDFADLRLKEAELNSSNRNLIPKPLLFPNGQTISYKSLVDLTGEPNSTSKFMFLPNDEMFRFKGVEHERSTTHLAPLQYRINDDNDARENVTTPKTNAPPLCPQKTKGSKQRKIKGKKRLNGEKDVCKRSHVHACESLLTLMIGAMHSDDESVVTVVRSAPEIPALLTQISACVAGTGLAVVFFAVAWMVNSSDVSRFVSLGVGLGLMWVAGSVMKLRDAIACIGKSSGDVAADVGRILNEMYFRCAVLLGLVLLQMV